MLILEIIFIAVGLSMDAFAVAMCRGLEMKTFNNKQALVIALFFGGFQAIMPLIGWAIGTQFARYITSVDHWIAFSLLLIIGGKMIFDSIKKDEEPQCNAGCKSLNIKQLSLMAVATSIDALAVGITFAFLHTNIGIAVGIIGSITFTISILGVFLGSKIGARFKNKAELLGGIVLVLIGLKILLEHLNIINF